MYRHRVGATSVDELEKGTGALRHFSASCNDDASFYRPGHRGTFTRMDWAQFVVLVLILLVLSLLLAIVVAVCVKFQGVARSADNLMASSSPLGAILRKLIST